MNKEQLITAPPQVKASALSLMASRLSVEPAKLLSTLKSTVFKGASDDELLALVVVANTYGLDPLLKEIYAFPGKGGGIVPVVSIDGWINRMNSNAQFDGVEFEDVFADGKPVSVTAIIWRKDRARPVKLTEYFSECFRNTEPWKTMPARMLRHKALMQCVRVAFGFGGVYDEDEARDIAKARDVTPTRFFVEEPKQDAPVPVPAESPAPAAKAAHKAKESKQDTKPADSEEAEVIRNEAPLPFTLGNSAPSPRETLASMMNESGVTETEVLEACKLNRIPVKATLAETSEGILEMLANDFDGLKAVIVDRVRRKK